MSTPTRFSDGQYKNWLKCSQSLIIMKEALHDYTDNEVRKLHGNITVKVFSIPCASSTGNQCGSCLSKYISLTGKEQSRKWSIKCKNSICDKWLQQILAVHESPHYNKINWKNADIRLWPVDCYQVAKIFMPKGQQNTQKMPNDLDAPAILSLFAYCKWFRKDLPNKQIMLDLIQFRNKVLHSGDLKVSDSDKDSKIDLMIRLLKDLKIPGDVISNLETLKKKDIDIKFRETEITVLQKCVAGWVNDTNTVKEDMATMKNSVSDLSENMETLGKVALNTDMEEIRKSLQEYHVIHSKMVSFFEKNPDIRDKEITEKFQAFGNDISVLHMDVKDLQSKLSRMETKLQELQSSLEKHREETDLEIKGIKDREEETKVELKGLKEREEETKVEIKGVKEREEETKVKLSRLDVRLAVVEEQQKPETGDSKSLEKGPDFAGSQTKFIIENVEKLDATKFLCLAFLFCNDKILEENLSSEKMPESSQNFFKQMATSLSVSENQASITLLKKFYDNLSDLYVVKSAGYFSLKPVVSEAVGYILGKRCCEMVVKYSGSKYLYQRTYTSEVEDSTSENVFLPVGVYGPLAERMVGDVVNKRLVSSVVKHSALKRPDFIKKLKGEINRCNKLEDFFGAGKAELQSGISEGNCVTFMQYVLQGTDVDVVRLVYSEFLQMLSCANNDNTCDCWRCEEKQNLLELALYYHHFEIADELIAMNARYTDVSLCNAARHGDLKRVETITEKLKKNKDFNPESKEAKYALYRAYVLGNQSLTDFLLKEGIVLDCCYVVNAVNHGDMNVLTNVVQHLKDNSMWNPDEEQQRICWRYPETSLNRVQNVFQKAAPCLYALYITYCNRKFNMAKYLVENDVKGGMCVLIYVIENCSQETALEVIQFLIDTRTWDPVCENASKALRAANCKRKDDVYNRLSENGVQDKNN